LKKRLRKYGLISSFEKLSKISKKKELLIPQEAIWEAVDIWQSRARTVEKARGGDLDQDYRLIPSHWPDFKVLPVDYCATDHVTVQLS